MGNTNQWCMIVMRKLRCTNDAGETLDVDDPVTVYGPFTKTEACARAEQFHAAHRETEDEEPYYRPVAEAPAFLDQENWPEHWAIVRPMNDVTVVTATCRKPQGDALFET